MKILKKIALSLFLFSSLFGNAQHYDKNVDDLALIWIGARHRPDWNKELFTPYLVHNYADGHKSWFFDGFLMIDGGIQDENNPSYFYTMGESPNNEMAPQKIMELFMDRQLGIETGLGCKALDDAIEDLLPVLGAPSYKHQVIMTIPIPRWECTKWPLNGKNLNFSVTEDRITAQKWYVERLLKRWKEGNFKNIELGGVYWLRESIDPQEMPMCRGINAYLKSIDIDCYWIPWLNAPYTDQWKELGFTTTYIQPGYVFDDTRPLERLQNACDNAWEFECGLEMEFEGCYISGLELPGKDTRVLKPQGNSCLYIHSPHFYDKFVAYIDSFEENKAFDFMPMSYYNGYQAIYDFAQSNHPKDIEVMDRLASILEKRHTVSGWYIPNQAGIDDIVAGQSGAIYGVPGGIYISNKVEGDVAVYSIDGRLIHSGKAVEDAGFRYGSTIPCQPGIYVVNNGSRSVKVSVR